MLCPSDLYWNPPALRGGRYSALLDVDRCGTRGLRRNGAKTVMKRDLELGVAMEYADCYLSLTSAVVSAVLALVLGLIVIAITE